MLALVSGRQSPLLSMLLSAIAFGPSVDVGEHDRGEAGQVRFLLDFLEREAASDFVALRE